MTYRKDAGPTVSIITVNMLLAVYILYHYSMFPSVDSPGANVWHVIQRTVPGIYRRKSLRVVKVKMLSSTQVRKQHGYDAQQIM